MTTRAIEQRVARVLSDLLGLEFSGTHYPLGDWGIADDSASVSPGVLLLLEVETSQRHPNTNVLKVWPFLESRDDTNVYLVHTFFEDSPELGSNRGKLAEWTASKMQLEFGSRFRYFKLVLDSDFRPTTGLDDLIAAVNSVKSDA